MQYHMSGAAAPGLVPKPVTVPEVQQPVTKPPRRWGIWVILAVIVIGAVGYWLRPSTSTETAKTAVPAGIRTAAVFQGAVANTIRLTGTTGAERYASLITPQLRGGRGGGGAGFGRSAREFSSGVNTSASVSSNSGGRSGGGGGGSSASSSSADTGGGGSTGPVSTAGTQGSGGMSSAMRSATSRVGGTRAAPTASRSTSSGSGASSSANSAAMGSSGLGSTASQLNQGGGGGGGGGASEFGLVLQELIKPGSFVKKGTEVAEFDRQYMLNRLDDFRASVVQTEASFKKMLAELDVAKKAHQQTIATAKAELDKAQLDVKTTPVLGAIDAERTRLALEEANARYKQLLAEVKFVDAKYRAQIRNAELELQQARLELKRAEGNMDKMVIKAPIDGLTVMQNTWGGSEPRQIQQGDQLFFGQMFMQIVDPRSMVVNATINQVDVDRIRVGQKAKVRFDAFQGLELPAHVYAIGAITKPGGMRANFVKEIPVVLKLDQMDPRIIPDLSVSADVMIENEERATVAPLGAIFADGPGQTPYVFVKNGDNYERRDVQLGTSSALHVAVRSGLRPGEIVALERPPARDKQSGT